MNRIQARELSSKGELPNKLQDSIDTCLRGIEAAARSGKWTYRPFDEGEPISKLTEGQKVDLFHHLQMDPYAFICDIDKGEIKW